MLLLEGRLRYRKYEDRMGNTRYVTEVVADKLIMLDRKLVFDEKIGDSIEDDLPFD